MNSDGSEFRPTNSPPGWHLAIILTIGLLLVVVVSWLAPPSIVETAPDLCDDIAATRHQHSPEWRTSTGCGS